MRISFFFPLDKEEFIASIYRRVKRRLYKRINSSLSIYPQDRQAEINVARARARRSIKFRSRARSRSLYFRVQSTSSLLRRLIEFNLSIRIGRVFLSSLAPTRDIASIARRTMRVLFIKHGALLCLSFSLSPSLPPLPPSSSFSLFPSLLLLIPLHSY